MTELGVSSGRARPPLAAALLVALAVATASSAAWVASVFVYSLGEACPSWESEGPTAAPASPYSRLLCSDSGSAVTPAVVVGAVVAVALGLWVLRARTGGRRWLRAAALLVAPALLVAGLHVVLPRDCLGGLEDSGDCARQREDL